MSKPFRIAIAGLGTVGGDVVKTLHERKTELSERAGRSLEIVAVSARDKTKARAGNVAGHDANVRLDYLSGANAGGCWLSSAAGCWMPPKRRMSCRRRFMSSSPLIA